MTHACAPAAGECWHPCDLNSTNMPIKVWAWYYRVRISHRPPPPPRGAHCCTLQHNSVWNREATVTKKSVKHCISFFSRAWMILFLSDVFDRLCWWWKHAVLSPKVWQPMSIICKKAQQGQTGNIRRLEIEGDMQFQSRKKQVNSWDFQDMTREDSMAQYLPKERQLGITVTHPIQ